MSNSSSPHLKTIALITAIIGICATVQEIVSKHMADVQEIKLAKEKNRAELIRTQNTKQDKEYAIIRRVLEAKGAERMLVLRYFANTLDDLEAKKWAKSEEQLLKSKDSDSFFIEEIISDINDLKKMQQSINSQFIYRNDKNELTSSPSVLPPMPPSRFNMLKNVSSLMVPELEKLYCVNKMLVFIPNRESLEQTLHLRISSSENSRWSIGEALNLFQTSASVLEETCALNT